MCCMLNFLSIIILGILKNTHNCIKRSMNMLNLANFYPLFHLNIICTYFKALKINSGHFKVLKFAYLNIFVIIFKDHRIIG
jgi:hypothetical protein